jgi:hypothetical protein
MCPAIRLPGRSAAAAASSLSRSCAPVAAIGPESAVSLSLTTKHSAAPPTFSSASSFSAASSPLVPCPPFVGRRATIRFDGKFAVAGRTESWSKRTDDEREQRACRSSTASAARARRRSPSGAAAHTASPPPPSAGQLARSSTACGQAPPSSSVGGAEMLPSGDCSGVEARLDEGLAGAAAPAPARSTAVVGRDPGPPAAAASSGMAVARSA